MRKHSFPNPSDALQKYAHGTYACYRLGKCRCEPCRKAVRDYERERQARNRPTWEMRYSPSGGHYVVRHKLTGAIHARPKTKAEALRVLAEMNAGPTSPNALVDTTPICVHVARLREMGIGLKTIVKVARVSRTVLTAIVDGEIKKTRQRMVDKILAVNADQIPDGMKVKSDSTAVLIERLVAAGFTRTRIRQMLGLRAGGLCIARAGYVTAGTARRVREIYRRLAANGLSLPSLPPSGLEGHPIRVRAPKALVGVVDYRHGTTSAYEAGCRCTECLQWHAEVRQARASRKALRFIVRHRAGSWVIRDLALDASVLRTSDRQTAFETRDVLNVNDEQGARAALVDRAPVREHIERLRARGLSDRDIGVAAHITAQAVFEARQPRRKKVLLTTARAILAVAIDAPASGYVTIDSAAANEMLDRMVAVGFDSAWIAHLLGRRAWSIKTRAHKMRLSNARAIADLYAMLRTHVRALRDLEDRIARAGAPGAQHE